jgi:tRNA/tmRNA/rRNA uracil-C5-methylase (TrmA/RlmC/RlmD family)
MRHSSYHHTAGPSRGEHGGEQRASRNVEFKGTTIEKALKAAADGLAYDLTDTRAEGLVLRVAPRGVKWGWRRKVRGSTWGHSRT